jgi:diadenylate cyclase
MSETILRVGDFLGLNGPVDIIRMIVDIGLVSYLIYKGIQLVRETRALQLVKGILFILIGAKLSQLFGLSALAYLFEGMLQLLGFGLLVLFQPELRRALEKIGSSGFQDLFVNRTGEDLIRNTTAIEAIVRTCQRLSAQYVGALIVIERDTKLGEIVNTGTQMDSLVSSELLENLFTPKSPLHDGAVVIRDARIKAAACYLPLTENSGLSRELGTRHRAALGISEVSDAIAVVVSEESGKISYAHNGGLTRNLTPDMLRKALNRFLIDREQDRRRFKFRKVNKSEQAD